MTMVAERLRWLFARVLPAVTVLTSVAWAGGNTNGASTPAPRPATQASGLVHVEVVKTTNGWELLRGGQPYFIKGVGGPGSKELLARCGGNSFRTWGSDDLEGQLDEAQKLGLTVAAGIWLGHKRHGFDYHNADQVKKQFQMARDAVLRYRNHPALLVWGIGNEMENEEPAGDPAVWQAVQDIAAMIKKEDPNHPTMTVIAEVGGDKVSQLHKFCPDIDIVGINTYAGASTIAGRYKQAGGTKPYVITEFGPPGQWEMKKTTWGAVPELSSTEKADWYRKTYVKSVLGEPALCLGSYAFTWGFKREATATWYGMFLPDGSKLAAVDVMTQLWGGKPSAAPCPVVKSLKVDGDARVDTGAVVHATLVAASADDRPIKVTWALYRDWYQYEVGESMPEAPQYPEAIVNASDEKVELKMPGIGGAYRLYAYVHSDKGGAAVANVSLFANGPEPKPQAPRAALPLVIFGSGQEETPYAPTGWMGNYSAIGYTGDCRINPHSGKTCLKLEYREPSNWGGMMWQSPANDWGDKPGGFNLTGAKRLTFWARSEEGGEKVSFVFGGIGSDKKYHDSASGKIVVELKKDWQQYAIDLDSKDLSCIKTGFGWTLAAPGRPVAFYLDDIQYE